MTLVSIREYSDYYNGSRTYYGYMIRLVRPKYEVVIVTTIFDKSDQIFKTYTASNPMFFRSEEEVEELKRSYNAKSNDIQCYDFKVTVHKPTDQMI